MKFSTRPFVPGLATLLLPVLPIAAQTPAPAHPDDHTAMHADKPPVPPSHAVSLSVNGRRTTLTVDDLLKLPQTTIHVHNAHNNQDETYTGPLLADVLAQGGLASTKENESVILHSAVVATATDRYFTLFSAAEVEPAFSKSQVIVALMKSGLPDTAGGNIQIINTDGARPARWVHGLLDLNVITLAAKFSPATPATENPPSPASAPR